MNACQCNLFYSIFFFSSRRRHTRFKCDWSSDVCSSDLSRQHGQQPAKRQEQAAAATEQSGAAAAKQSQQPEQSQPTAATEQSPAQPTRGTAKAGQPSAALSCR